MATVCWSSIPFDLIDRIAGRLLDTADLDCYMSFRAVCRNWRSGTTDPRNTLDHRFRPHNWVMLDYPSHGEDARLLVNTATGRFHGRNMPLLRKYYVVSVTTDGLLVLAARRPPFTTCVLNPFTGYMVRFAARMRRHVISAAVSGSSPPYLVIYCGNDSQKLYRANPDSGSFVRYKKKYAYPLVRKAIQGCIAIDGHQGLLPPLPAAVVTKLADLMTPFVLQGPDEANVASWKLCFLVESAGETLVVFKLENRVEVFKMEFTGGNATLQKVQSIGNRAIFIGGGFRCLSVDADKFPSIEADCVYYTCRLASSSTEMYHLKDGQQGQSASEAEPCVDLPAFVCNPLNAHPFSMVLLLSLYTLNSQAGQVSQVLECEDQILEELRTGKMTLSDLLLEASQAGTDTDDDD